MFRNLGFLAVAGLACATPAPADSLDDIMLPPGFVIEHYADVPNARSLALGEQGTLFVSNRSGSSIYAVVPGDVPGVIEIDSDLRTPNGVAFRDGDLYVAEIDRIYRYADIESRLDAPPEPERLDIELPAERHHGWRYIAFGPDGKLYVSIGAPCNVCDREGFAEIIRMNPDGSDRETFARGIRNSVGLAWHPETGELWFTDNGRDMLGDDIPACELNHAPRAGLHFGFPYCHAGDVRDPEFGGEAPCADFVPPAQRLGPHVAPLGLRFYTGTQFPDEYAGQIFIAEHGSWNRSEKIGYRITLVRLDGNRAVSYETFAEGWLEGGEVTGRPVDLQVMPDGSLLVSDDLAGKLYRIRYAGASATAASHQDRGAIND
ncbi:MAG: PQQ-dependent sugar dehydrogenase [Woeseiaceae bacterium]|jgi:glucose/arabinose dehydrogenase|nr:PQQ-dependent sugar dehydrogenase [Woeseiaceae bacterium]